jgi:hypothetical protein
MSWSCKYFTPDKTELGEKSSFSVYETRAYLSMAENRPNVPNHRHGISLREVSTLADAFKELSAHGELETEVVF